MLGTISWPRKTNCSLHRFVRRKQRLVMHLDQSQSPQSCCPASNHCPRRNSLQEDETGSILNGISKACIKYRPVDLGGASNHVPVSVPGLSRNQPTPSQSSAEATTTDPSRDGAVIVSPEPKAGKRPAFSGDSMKCSAAQSMSQVQDASVTGTTADLDQRSPKRAKLDMSTHGRYLQDARHLLHSRENNVVTGGDGVMTTTLVNQNLLTTQMIQENDFSKQQDAIVRSYVVKEEHSFETKFTIPGCIYDVDAIKGEISMPVVMIISQVCLQQSVCSSQVLVILRVLARKC